MPEDKVKKVEKIKEDIVNKIKKAKTDALPMPNTNEELDDRPEAKNLIGIYSSLSNVNLDDTITKFSGKNFSEFKEDLSQVLVDKISPISNEINKLMKDKMFLDKILKDGCDKANEIASKKMKKIQEIVGF